MDSTTIRIDDFVTIEEATPEERESFLKRGTHWMNDRGFMNGLNTHLIAINVNQNFEKHDVIIASNNVRFWLQKIFESSGANDLEFYSGKLNLKRKLFCVDDVRVLWVFTDSEAKTEFNFDDLRENLFESFPDKIKPVFELNLCGEDGKPVLGFKSFRGKDGVLMKEAFELFNDWFKQAEAIVRPQFEEVKMEIEDYLRNSYQINPQKKGFISWFITHKAGMGLKFQLKTTRVEDSRYGLGTILINLEHLKENFTPQIIEAHLHEYCCWKLAQQTDISNRLKISPPVEKLLSGAGGKEPQISLAATTKNKSFKTFDDLFGNEQQKKIVCAAMIALNIVSEDGTYLLGDREKSKMLAFARACKEKGKIISMSDLDYSRIFCERVGVNITKLKAGSYGFEQFYDKAMSHFNS